MYVHSQKCFPAEKQQKLTQKSDQSKCLNHQMISSETMIELSHVPSINTIKARAPSQKSQLLPNRRLGALRRMYTIVRSPSPQQEIRDSYKSCMHNEGERGKNVRWGASPSPCRCRWRNSAATAAGLWPKSFDRPLPTSSQFCTSSWRPARGPRETPAGGRGTAGAETSCWAERGQADEGDRRTARA